MRMIAMLGLVALLGACASVTPEKPGQAWYVTKATYAGLVEAAADYSDVCRAKPPALKAQCMPAVEKLQDYDNSAQEIEASGDLALANGDVELLDAATNHLETLKRRLEEELAAQLEAEAQPAGNEPAA